MQTRSGKIYIQKPTFKKTLQECSLCLESKYSSKFTKPIHRCGNQQPCCKICFGEYVKTKMSTTGFPIRCMFRPCEADLDFNDVYHCLPDSRSQELLKKTSMEKKLASRSDFRHCPRPDCEGGAFGVVPEDKRAICTACNLPFCIPCHDIDHPNQTCEEAKQNLDVEEKQTRSLLETETKRCPSCATPIFKLEGCNHMCCISCGYNFCWICLKQYVIGHFRQHQPQNNRTINVEQLTLNDGQQATRVTVTPRLHGRFTMINQHMLVNMNQQRLFAFRELEKLANEKRILVKQLQDAGIEPTIEFDPRDISLAIQQRFPLNAVRQNVP